MKHARPTVLYAAAVRDAAGVNASPGAVLVQDGEVVVAGEPESLPGELVEQAEVIKRPNDLLLPAMVNAHTHLELTGIGPQPYDPAGGFVGWVKMIREKAPKTLKEFNHASQRGAEMAYEAGVQWAGNISTPLPGEVWDEPVGFKASEYIELFGLGPPFDERSLELIESVGDRLQPHAPYSAGRAIYEAATQSEKGFCTHLAETVEEVEFVAHLRGPLFDYVNTLGRWREDFAAQYGDGLSPVQWMRPYFEMTCGDECWMVVHCNYVDDDDIALLAETKTSVAYCPIASEYFGHKDHRYRDMLAAGINVCLGTDSIVCTDPDDPQPLGLLSAMRRLYERDGTAPATLLAMATINGAKALEVYGGVGSLKPGAPARFACIPIDRNSSTDPLVQVLTGQDPIEAISFDA